MTRRRLLGTAAAAVASGAAGRTLIHAEARAAAQAAVAAPPKQPVVIASANGLRSVERAAELLMKGADPLEAVVSGVQIVEDDPSDHSVGYGGLPNEEGVVELDASVMHGPTHKAAGVASLRNIRHPSRVAMRVLERTDHVLLVGDGALRFARAHGFKEENLLTDEARQIWLNWKESLSTEDDWLPPASAPAKESHARGPRLRVERITGTINCCCVTTAGDLAGCTTTSGLAFKIPGRVGDSPIIGAGLYVDNQVGAAGSTGRGEANLQNCSSFAIVELLRSGLSPKEACLKALQRVADRTEPRLRNKKGRPDYDLKFYALAKNGDHAGVTMYQGGKYAVHENGKSRLVEMAFLYDGSPTH